MKLTRASQDGRCPHNTGRPQPGEYRQHGSTPSKGRMWERGRDGGREGQMRGRRGRGRGENKRSGEEEK